VDATWFGDAGYATEDCAWEGGGGAGAAAGGDFGGDGVDWDECD